MNILIVDDEVLVRWFFKRSLGKWGHTVVTAENVPEAQALTDQQTFDLVIIDLQFPDCNGIDLVRYLLARQYKPEKLVVCSASFSTEIQQELTQRKIRMLMKPFTMKELKRAIEGNGESESSNPLFLNQISSWETIVI